MLIFMFHVVINVFLVTEIQYSHFKTGVASIVMLLSLITFNLIALLIREIPYKYIAMNHSFDNTTICDEPVGHHISCANILFSMVS